MPDARQDASSIHNIRRDEYLLFVVALRNQTDVYARWIDMRPMSRLQVTARCIAHHLFMMSVVRVALPRRKHRSQLWVVGMLARWDRPQG